MGFAVFTGFDFVVIIYPSTSTPILRAVPAMVLTAVSILAAVKSGAFNLAISSNCLRVILPTFTVLGVALPLSKPNVFLINTDAGGVLIIKLKLRSLYTVIITGKGMP